MQPRLHRAELDSEDLGGLLERQAVEVVEDDDALVLLRQRGDPLADDLAELGLLGALGGQRPVVGDGVLARPRRSGSRRGAAATGASSTGSATRGAATAAARRPSGTCGGAGRRARTCPAGSLPQPADRPSAHTPSGRSGCGSGRRTPRRRRGRRPGHGATAPHPFFWLAVDAAPPAASFVVGSPCAYWPPGSLTHTIPGHPRKVQSRCGTSRCNPGSRVPARAN